MARFPLFLLAALLVTIIFGTQYWLSGQMYRQSADDPQVQIAYDIKAALENGAPPATLLPSFPSDLEKSLSPFAIIFDDSSNVVVSSATLNGDVPKPPQEIFDGARTLTEHRATWQPRPDIRVAVVMLRVSAGGKNPVAGFVAVGRSLREAERREADAALQVTFAWATVLLILIVYAAFSGFWERRK